jgi:hypothetical protein
MYGLILPCEANGFKAPVRSVRLSPPGSSKGVRLIHLESLLNYLHELSEAGEGGEGRGAPSPVPTV